MYLERASFRIPSNQLVWSDEGVWPGGRSMRREEQKWRRRASLFSCLMREDSTGTAPAPEWFGHDVNTCDNKTC